MKKLFTIFLCIALLPCIAQAGTYWVHPYGTAANWAACSSATDPGGTCVEGNCANYCTLAQANTASNTAPGDIIKLKGGTYDTHIYPGESGEAAARITYEAVTGETPVIINTTTTYGTYYHGINLTARSYITIRGVTVGPDISGTMTRLMMITNGASYNEIDSCEIYGYFGGEMIKIYDNVTANDDTPCVHNWIHDSIIANNMKLYNCSGGVCELMGMQIGDASYDHGSGFNTIEGNTFYMNGHHNLETFTKSNVIRNNFMHQAPGLTEETDGTPAYTPDSNDKYGHRNIQIYGSDGVNPMNNLIEGNKNGPSTAAPENDGGDGFTLTARGNIMRYNDIYGAQNNGLLLKAGDTASIAVNNRIYNNTISGSGRYENGPVWQGYDLRWYVSQHSVAPSINSIVGVGGTVTVVTATSHAFYTGCSVTVASTTNFNGTYTITRVDETTFTFSKAGDIAEETTGTVQGKVVGALNVIKNNIFNGGASGDVTYGGYETYIAAINTISNNWLAATGNPSFTDSAYPAITATQSKTDTNFALQSGSGAIDGGAALTTVHADDTGSGTALVVTDALYFQDGTWGSSLSNIQPDWIAVGATVAAADIVQISSIDYDTNTITLAESITRADGEYVWLYKKSDGTQVLYGSAPDYGAHEYQETATIRGVTASGVTIR